MFLNVVIQVFLKVLGSASLLLFAFYSTVYVGTDESAEFWRIFSTAQLVAFLSRYALDASLIVDPQLNKHKPDQYIFAGYCLLVSLSLVGTSVFGVILFLQNKPILLAMMVLFINTVYFFSFVLRRCGRHLSAVLFDPNITFSVLIVILAVGGIPSINTLTMALGVFSVFSHFAVYYLINFSFSVPKIDILAAFLTNAHSHFKISSSNFLVNQGSIVFLNWWLPIDGVAIFNMLQKLWSTMRLFTIMFNSTVSKQVSDIYSASNGDFTELSETVSYYYRNFFKLFCVGSLIIAFTIYSVNLKFGFLNGYLVIFFFGILNELIVARTGLAANIAILSRLTFKINAMNYASIILLISCVFVIGDGAAYLISLFISINILRNLSFPFFCYKYFAITFFR